ncbi:b(o/a)3-type cytochrome-c oxidase subunit 1 [Halalkalibacterium halodurans]|jgi:cytochrome c oxidase subunit 1|uniref:b(o/a)3-type cytochrome-c oxidase subunit 1 n=1 Tax=Halalkalibacterium halodurans TaxID=86665 RepID=UPI002AAA3A09|nr:b(o/a)3-type cytochrome-c oxidase subunit 1 [Halalkalibacterium halodurans]MDY7221244.1 b(o/a)3-type cytochrome-c oxidase subunit 1 [Halalkalibacterium halodurans]MDY7240483.1 b(o/a)3-type cytochrome-c oxidase subunit 1 [Halalkalibacterium halodurans]MED4080365.1 b(o/a)3-type cytochrome-c oxidase subunit 1 [Halalkalibacterium halodurans]MED4084571.1 b(o/a)3-type cytochrome-c oxidase subunit 1 [Halalkalibacterium halodurans]MED4104865.1 b(o/a)3-type cytochrome-c oxidase subunit 1 [Halalkalib
MNTETALRYQKLTITDIVTKPDRKLALTNINIAYAAFLVGTLCGLLQVFIRNDAIQLPAWLDYYQILTAHGVLLALVFTTYFIFGFFYTGMSKTLGSFSDNVRMTSWIGFFVMTLGTIITVIMIVSGEASVLYTFYAPLQANGFFYIGLAFVVVGTWISGFALIGHYVSWKKRHKGSLSPLFAFMTVTTLILWIIACLGVVATVLFQFIPLAFGWVDTINVGLSRTLFWYFGHPLVYFWLLPAYMAWYLIVPKLLGVNVFSDSLARLAFILFLLFSIPVGFHHQAVDPGIDHFWKFLQTVLTFMVIIPSLMTAFSMFAVFEISGREKGGKGLFGWFTKLPWRDVRFLSLFLAMLFFIPGGIGGIINASFQLNEVVHNTLWVVGHFHITVGAPVAMTFYGLTFWLVPYLTGRPFSRLAKKLALIQVITWSLGMFLMSTAQHVLGLLGAPRRTAFTEYGGHEAALTWFDGIFSNHVTMAVGGTILFLSAMLLIVIVVISLVGPKATEEEIVEFPLAESDPSSTPKLLEKWWVWIGIAAFLIIAAYAIPIAELLHHMESGSRGFRTW